MHAAVVSPDVDEPPVSWREWPDPRLPDGWVVVRVVRAALNRLDQMTLDERTDLPGPAVIGSDAAGVVEAVGRHARGVAVGDEVVISPSLWWGPDDSVQGSSCEVLGSPTQGTHAELVAVPAENVHRKPSRLSWDEAAALPLAGLTAWRAVVTRGALREGQTMVVTAASSGVGSLAVQIGHALGARVVAVTSSEQKAAEARALGADVCVLRTSEGFASELSGAARGADLVVESTGAGWPALVECLRPGGRMVVLGRRAQDTGHLPVRVVYWRQLHVMGTSLGSPRDFTALLAHVEQARWSPVVDSTVELREIAGAYERLSAAERFGKVVLQP